MDMLKKLGHVLVVVVFWTFIALWGTMFNMTCGPGGF